MPEYLSKEEIKQWRSSLEKITLEEYAARLGKVLEDESNKHTNDMVDMVLNHKPSVTITRVEDISRTAKKRKLNEISAKAFAREKEIKTAIKDSKVKTTKNNNVDKVSEEEKIVITISGSDISAKDAVKLTFAKALTDREQSVFDYFIQNRGKIVYARDLANLLGLPRDYVYKYIKNLRSKIEGDKLQNAENGGYILNV